MYRLLDSLSLNTGFFMNAISVVQQLGCYSLENGWSINSISGANSTQSIRI